MPEVNVEALKVGLTAPALPTGILAPAVTIGKHRTHRKVVFAEEPVHEDEHADDDDDAEYKRAHASASPAQSVPDDEDESNLYTHKKDAYEDYCTALQWAKEKVKSKQMTCRDAALASSKHFDVAMSAEAVRIATLKDCLPKGFPGTMSEGADELILRSETYVPCYTPRKAVDSAKSLPARGSRLSESKTDLTRASSTADLNAPVPSLSQSGASDQQDLITSRPPSPTKTPAKPKLGAEDRDICQWIYACTGGAPGPFSKAIRTASHTSSSTSSSTSSCRPFSRGVYSKGSAHYM